jgi:oxygen-independent coproporphyrinogen-3 oxidase
VSQAKSDTFEIPELETVEKLISKYDQPGPRYTSYPTAPVWTEEFGERDFRDALGRSPGGSISVYIHIPFCESLCSYCACNREIHRDHGVVGPYLEGLECEAERTAEAVGKPLQSVQLAMGGGTPTYLSAEELSKLCDIVDAHFPPAQGAERSIEVDPRITTREQLEVLASKGFNRISLGVQDLSPKVQQAIHRFQSREETEVLAQSARELGFGSVNFDLIYGLPYQTVESFDDTLNHVIEMRPDRIALYSYAHVTWVSRQQRGFEKKDLPSPERKVAIFLMAMRRLGDAGYRFFGLDHFALPDDELSLAAETGELRRNFMGYTTRGALDLLGLGASSISELSDAYAQSVRTSEEWIDRLADGGFATMRGWHLSEGDRRRKWLIQHLMCQGQINPEAYRARFDESLAERVPGLEERLAPLVADGLLAPEGTGYGIRPLGRLFLRPVAMTFDEYLEPKGDGDQPRFSRTV